MFRGEFHSYAPASQDVTPVNILTKYILKKFLKPFLASFAALCILLLVSEFFERLDRFLAEEIHFRHIAGYLLAYLPLQAAHILPIACLLGTLFVVGDLVRHKEYIAGLAGGIPPERFLKGLLWAGLVISFFGLVANETIVPLTAQYATRVFQEKIRRVGEWQQSVFDDFLVAGAEGRIWNTKRFDQKSGRMDRVVVDTYSGGRMSLQVDAQSAQWSPAGWTFYNGSMRTFEKDNISLATLEGFSEKKFYFREKPTDLITQEPEPEEMNFKNLKRHIDRLSSLGVPVRALEVELMMKFSFPFACFVVTLLGVPLSMTLRGSRAMGIAAGTVLSLLYMGFIEFGKALAQRHIAPWMGAWLGNLMFLSLGLYLWWRMRKAA